MILIRRGAADMNSASSTNPSPVVLLPHGALGVITSGYSVEAVGLIALLTINGTSSVPLMALVATIILIVAGFLLPTAGLLALRRGLDRTHAAVRRNFLLQGAGLVVLLLGVVVAVGINSLSGFIAGTALLAVSAALALLGSIMLRSECTEIGLPGPAATNYLVLAMVLLFSGVGLIMAANIAFFYVISGAANGVDTDIGATISAYGCVVAAYSFLGFRRNRFIR